MPNDVMDGFFSWRIKVTYHFDKRLTKTKTADAPDRTDIPILKDRLFLFFCEKHVQKYTFYQKNAGYWCGHW